MKASWNSAGFLTLKDVDSTRVGVSPASDFYPIAKFVGDYEIDTYTDDEITITHTDPALSGTYDLGTNPTLLEAATPHLTAIYEVLQLVLTNAYLNVIPAGRVDIVDVKKMAAGDAKKLGKAIYGIVQVAVLDRDQ